MSENVLGKPTIAIMSSNPIHILHVDDDDAFLDTAKQCLEIQEDIHVESARSVKEAIEILKTKKFDVIISDYQMGEKDGLEFLSKIKATGIITPFILFTGRGQDEVAVKALNLGAFRYMNKRGTPEVMYTELSSCIHQATELTRNQELLKKNERLFRAIFDSLKEALLVFNDAGEISYNNKAAQIFLDYAKDEITQKINEHFSKQFAATYKQNTPEGFKQISDCNVSAPAKTIELALKKASGETTIVELSFSALTEQNRLYGVGILQDVTDRKKKEQLNGEA